jgi:hypothetical protein
MVVVTALKALLISLAVLFVVMRGKRGNKKRRHQSWTTSLDFTTRLVKWTGLKRYRSLFPMEWMDRRENILGRGNQLGKRVELGSQKWVWAMARGLSNMYIFVL